ncbi:MAG: hypothetical protein NC251_06465 [Lachnoclostridium sp.]|nr:hypothetical protein [Lachnospira sp.]MCM1248058.1 hypothetical protein [Lachnoclostridium sp.]
MKKKLCLLGMAFFLCAGLTACGSPLKKLPQATGENIYDEDEETTGNDFADEILDDLSDEGGIAGEVVSFIVNERNDKGDSKERSELKVEITTNTKTLEYKYYYVVDCRYRDGEWVMKTFSQDEEEDSLIAPLKEMSQEEIKDILVNKVSSYDYTPDNWSDRPVTFSQDGITGITVNSQKLVPAVVGAGNDPSADLDITVTWTNGFCNYTGDFELSCLYVVNSNTAEAQWAYKSIVHSGDYAMELTKETETALSDEKMTADLAGYPLLTDSYNFRTGLVLNGDTIDSITFDDIVWNDKICTRRANIILADQSIFKVHVIADFTYSYNGSEWNQNSIKYSAGYNDGMNSCWASDNDLVGNYTGDMKNNSGTQYATIYISITTVNEDGSLGGALKIVPSGTYADTVESIEFTGSYNERNMLVDLTFDQQRVKYGAGSWDYTYVNRIGLRYNVESSALVSTSYNQNFILTKDED